MCHQPFRRGQAVGVEAITSRLGSKQAPGSKALSRRAAFRPALDEEGAPHQRTRRLHGQLTVKKSPPTFVQAGPMDPWALMQKALLGALVLQESALFQAEHAHAAQDQCLPGA